MQTIPFSEVRAHLAEALSDMEEGGEPRLISRRGKPTAVLMSVAQYQALLSRAAGPAARLTAWREQHAAELQSLGGDGDPFANLRDRREGRPVTWADDIADADADAV